MISFGQMMMMMPLMMSADPYLRQFIPAGRPYYGWSLPDIAKGRLGWRTTTALSFLTAPWKLAEWIFAEWTVAE